MSEAPPTTVTINAPFQCTVAIGVAPTTSGGQTISYENVLAAAKVEHSFAEAINRFGLGVNNAFTIEVTHVDVYGAGSGTLQVAKFNIHPAPFERYPNISSERNLKQGGVVTMFTTVDRKAHYRYDIPDSASKARIFNLTASVPDDTFTISDPIIAVKYVVPVGSPTFDYALCEFGVILRRIISIIPSPLMIEDIHAATAMKGNTYKNLMELVKKREHDDDQIHKIDRIKRLCLPTNAVA